MPSDNQIFQSMSSSILWIGQFYNNKLLPFFTAKCCSCISFGQCMQVDRLNYWGLVIMVLNFLSGCVRENILGLGEHMNY